MYELFSLFEEQFAHRIDADSDGEIQNVFHAVRNTRRRYVVYYLQSLPDQTSDLSDLATQIAAWEEDCEPGDVEPETRKRVYVGCYQSHLPTLDEEGIVRYEKENGRVELTGRGRILGEYLSLFEGEESFPLEDTDWARLN